MVFQLTFSLQAGKLRPREGKRVSSITQRVSTGLLNLRPTQLALKLKALVLESAYQSLSLLIYKMGTDSTVISAWHRTDLHISSELAGADLEHLGRREVQRDTPSGTQSPGLQSSLCPSPAGGPETLHGAPLSKFPSGQGPLRHHPAPQCSRGSFHVIVSSDLPTPQAPRPDLRPQEASEYTG